MVNSQVRRRGQGLWHRSILKLEKARISLIKVNLRLGGVNIALTTAPKLFIKWIMIGGADVTHPGQSSLENCPSQLMLLLLGGCFNQYSSAFLRCQESKKKCIVDHDDMLIEEINRWKLSLSGE